MIRSDTIISFDIDRANDYDLIRVHCNNEAKRKKQYLVIFLQ